MSTTASPADIAAVTDVLKEVWVSDTLRSQLYDDMILFDWIDDVKEYTDSDGLKASVPLKTGRTGGVGSRGIGQQLPVADHQKVGKASYNYKLHYLQIMLYNPVIARMATDRQSCVREIDFEVTNGIEDLKHMICRQLHGDGSGNLLFNSSGLPGNAASTTILLGAANYYVIERGWLYEGMRIDVGTAASPTARGTGLTITAVTDSSSAPAITVDASVTPQAGDGISLYGNRAASAVSYEMNGLRSVIDDATSLGGIDPSTKSYWKATVVDGSASAGALTIEKMLTTLRKMRQRGDYPDVAIGDLFQEQKYYQLLQQQVQFVGDKDLAAGNTEGLAFAKMKLVGDPEAIPGRIDFLKKSALQMYSAGEIEWQNTTTGGDVLAWKQDYDAWVARAAKYCELGTDRRRSFGTLEGLATS
jgi:hypothetical protein